MASPRTNDTLRTGASTRIGLTSRLNGCRSRPCDLRSLRTLVPCGAGVSWRASNGLRCFVRRNAQIACSMSGSRVAGQPSFNDVQRVSDRSRHAYDASCSGDARHDVQLNLTWLGVPSRHFCFQGKQPTSHHTQNVRDSRWSQGTTVHLETPQISTILSAQGLLNLQRKS